MITYMKKHRKTPTRNFYSATRDKNGRKIERIVNDVGYEILHFYDDNENLTHLVDSEGNEKWLEYNSNGRLFHIIDSNKGEKWIEENIPPDYVRIDPN